MKNYLICAYGQNNRGGVIHNSFFEGEAPITQKVIEKMREDIKTNNGFNSVCFINIIPLADETED